jgi:hypothetical protein
MRRFNACCSELYSVWITDRAVSQSASLSWCQAPIWDPRSILLSPWNFFRQLRFCNFVVPSLMRGRACNLFVQLLLGLARAVILGSKSRRTRGHILLSLMRLPQPGGPGSRIYVPQEQGGPVIPPDTVFPFCRLLRLAGTTVEVF